MIDLFVKGQKGVGRHTSRRGRPVLNLMCVRMVGILVLCV
jgi:hypothetical protein